MTESILCFVSAVVFLPALAALVIAFLPGDRPEAARYVTLAATAAVFVMCLLGFVVGNGGPTAFDPSIGTMQNVFNVAWIPSFDIEYFMGMDGISFPLVILTGLVSLISFGASWSIEKHVKAYCILYLLLLTGMLGVFLALDMFLFYVFWEVMLLPMYFLIGVWGGPRREYAAIKFFLYTLAGSVLMLIAILMLYFHSDLRELARREQSGEGRFAWNELHIGSTGAARVGRGVSTADSKRADAAIAFLRSEKDTAASKPLSIKFVSGTATVAAFEAKENALTITFAADATAANVVKAISENETLKTIVGAALPKGSDGAGKVTDQDGLTLAPHTGGHAVHTFNILALQAMGQDTELFNVKMMFGKSLQWWAFVLLFIGFAVKVPSVPVHTWLPDAHVEAPTPISMILAGVLLKMGGYGIIRICYPICPHGGFDLAYVVCLLGVVSMVYGAFAALAQTDFKRMVAYSSVSHMGYVVLGLGVWSASMKYGGSFDWQYWNMGVKGAMFQMIGHGISSPGMFLMVGIIYERVHHRNLEEFGGLFGKMPVYTAMAMGIFFAGLGLPGMCGFVGEVLVVFSVWRFDEVLAVISASVVILTAAYILWAVQRVYLGAEYKGPHGDHLTPSTLRENVLGMTLLALCVICGVFPHQTVLKYMDATIDRQVSQLADWTEKVKEKADSPVKAAVVPATPESLSLNAR